ncbi:hypothetical protein GCM10017612_21210 [Novosphingobium resinovorum]|nr:hypothetical protein GCM10017612_21210 [Novosphingobium resinovorum]
MELSDGIEVEPGCTVSYPAARQSFTENKTPRPGEDAPDADPMFASDALTFPRRNGPHSPAGKVVCAARATPSLPLSRE